MRSIGSICTATFKDTGSPASGLDFEGRLYVLRHPARRHKNGIEAHVVSRMFGVGCKPGLGSRDNTAALAGKHGLRRGFKLRAGLNFDENDQLSSLDHEVDFADRAFPTFGESAISLGG